MGSPLPVESTAPLRTSARTPLLIAALPLLAAAAYVAVVDGLAATGPDRWVLVVPATAFAAWLGIAVTRSAGRHGAPTSPWALTRTGVGFLLAAIALPVLSAAG